MQGIIHRDIKPWLHFLLLVFCGAVHRRLDLALTSLLLLLLLLPPAGHHPS
jgi:hypothetical protein